MRPLFSLGVALLVVAAFGACEGGNGDDGGDSSLEQALRRMVVQIEDLPEGFVEGDELLTTNEYQASLSADPDARMDMLEEWGRLLGYEVTYRPGADVSGESPVQGINVSASLYDSEEGAAEAFLVDAVQAVEQTDWAANYAGLSSFQREDVDAGGLADEIVWLRLSGVQRGVDGPDALVIDDLVFFRVGRERGFMRVLISSTETEDRGHLQGTVRGWLEAQVQRVSDALEEGGLGAEDGE